MKIRAIWAGGGGPAPLWVANVGGYFAGQGLDVDCFQIPGSGNCTRALIDGSAEIGIFAAPAAIAWNLRHRPETVILAAHYNTLLVTLNGRPGIESTAALKGKRLGMGVQGEVEDYILRTVLPLIGYTLADFQTVPKGEAAPWLTTGDNVDVLLLQPPQSLEGPKAGWRALLDVVPMNIAYQLGCIVASRRWVEAHFDETLALIRGYAEGLYRFVADQELGVDVMRRWTSTSDLEALRATHELYAQRFEMVPYPTLDGIAAILQTIDAPAAGAARPGDFVDARFVRRLEEEGLFAELRQRFMAKAPD